MTGLPGDLSTVTVTGRFLDATGAALRGSVTFTPSAVVTDSTGHVVVDGPRTYWLSGGSFESNPLVATDNELSPAGWQYDTMIALEDSQPQAYSLAIPHTPSPVDISALIAAVS
jgi:hypothetical protein